MSAVIRPGENLPRVQMTGATWKHVALISISAGNPSAIAGHVGVISAATMPTTITTALVM